MIYNFRYLLLCTVVLGCHQQASTGHSSQGQGPTLPPLQLAITRPYTAVYHLDSRRGAVTKEAAPEGLIADSPAWEWQSSQPVAVWGSLGAYSWVYPLMQDERGQPTLESIASATYALASDMKLVLSSSLEFRGAVAAGQDALYLPAKSASCPSNLLQQHRLVPRGLMQASEEAPLLSRGATGSYLVYQGTDGHTELVSSSCSHLIGSWTNSMEEEPLEETIVGPWRYGRSSEQLLQTLVSHRFGEEMLVEAPEELPDIASRPPLCQGSAEESDALRISLYSAESFVLQVLAKLPVALREQLQSYWTQALNTTLGQEWLENFKQPTDGMDSGMQSLLDCHYPMTPLQMAENLAGLRTSTTRPMVSKTRFQLQHVAFENRLLEATQLLNEAARRYETANESHSAYRFHRRRVRDSKNVGFHLLYFDGKQSLATQKVPGVDKLVFPATQGVFRGLARNYEADEYFVNLDAARLVDLLENSLDAAIQTKGTATTADWSWRDLYTATHIPRFKSAFKAAPWVGNLVNAVYAEFDKWPRANDYELGVMGLSSQSAAIEFYLRHSFGEPMLAAKESWRRLLVLRLVRHKASLPLAARTVEGQQGDQRPEFEAELFRIVDACGASLGIGEFSSRYVKFRESPVAAARQAYQYMLTFSSRQLYADTGISFETLYETCMPLVEDSIK
jgi:hypothetical protein